MIKVRVKNFQSIKDAIIEVDGFTVITGPNNSGKSALMRAIRGIFQNTPGTSFIRHGTEKAVVEMDLGDHTVKWSKGVSKKTRPTYVLDDGSPIHPGRGIPDEVKALGVQSIEAGGRDVWPQFAPQFTGQVFLLDQPGSVLAEAVADVERVGQLSRALKAAQSDGRSAAATLKVRLKDQVHLREELDKFDGLDDVAAQSTTIEKGIVQAAKIKRAMEGLTNIRDRLTEAFQTVESLEGVEQIVVPDDTITPILDELFELKDVQIRLEQTQQQVDTLEGINHVEGDVDGSEAEKILNALDILSETRSRISAADSNIRQIEQDLEDAKQDEQVARDELVGGLEDLGNCPMCGHATGSGDHYDH